MVCAENRKCFRRILEVNSRVTQFGRKGCTLCQNSRTALSAISGDFIILWLSLLHTLQTRLPGAHSSSPSPSPSSSRSLLALNLTISLHLQIVSYDSQSSFLSRSDPSGDVCDPCSRSGSTPPETQRRETSSALLSVASSLYFLIASLKHFRHS